MARDSGSKRSVSILDPQEARVAWRWSLTWFDSHRVPNKEAGTRTGWSSCQSSVELEFTARTLMKLRAVTTVAGAL